MMAADVGIAPQTYWNAENNVCVDRRTIERIARFLKLDTKDLIVGPCAGPPRRAHGSLEIKDPPPLPLLARETATHTSVMLLARDAAAGPGLVISPVAVQLTGAVQPGAQVADGDVTQQALVRSAVFWAGHYVSAIGGKLSGVLANDYLGPNKPYNHAVFTTGCNKPWPEEIARAAYGMAWLVEVLRSTLAYDLKLPSGFPRVTWLVAAGFVPGQAGIAEMPDSVAAISQFQAAGRACVLYPRRQQADLTRIVAPDRMQHFSPVDEPQDIARAVLVEAIKCLMSPEVRDVLRQRFRDALTALLQARNDLHDGELATRAPALVLTELVQRALARKKEADYLKAKIREVEQTASATLPLASRITEDLDNLRDQWLEEAGIVTLVRITPDEQPDLDRCHTIWRRLSAFVHPDQSELKELPECLQITTLNDNKQDLLYLLGMEGAIDPFHGLHPGPSLESDLRLCFDRLFYLQDLLAQVWSEAEEKRKEAASYGTEWEDMLGEEAEEAREALRFLEARIDAYWRDLRRRLGREPAPPEDKGGRAA
jgi:hypothetical protein